MLVEFRLTYSFDSLEAKHLLNRFLPSSLGTSVRSFIHWSPLQVLLSLLSYLYIWMWNVLLPLSSIYLFIYLFFIYLSIYLSYPSFRSVAVVRCTKFMIYVGKIPRLTNCLSEKEKKMQLTHQTFKTCVKYSVTVWMT